MCVPDKRYLKTAPETVRVHTFCIQLAVVISSSGRRLVTYSFAKLIGLIFVSRVRHALLSFTRLFLRSTGGIGYINSRRSNADTDPTDS